jgi:hypothetical protein
MCEACGQQLTKCKLNIPCLQLLASSVVGELAREGGEVVHKVIRNILQHLQAQSSGLAMNMRAAHAVLAMDLTGTRSKLTDLHSIGLELKLRIDRLREILQPRRREVVAAVRHWSGVANPSFGPATDTRTRDAQSCTQSSDKER